MAAARVRSTKNTNEGKHSWVYYKNNIEPFLNTSETLQKYLKQACFDGDWSMARHLLEKGANMNYRYDDDGQTLLFYCTTTNEIKGLMELGADINARNKTQQTPLGHAICKLWSIDLIRLLLKYGAHVNTQVLLGFSPLTWAIVRLAKLEIITLLLEYKANNNGTDQCNPLIFVLYDKNYAEVLIKYGVLQNAENDCKKIIKLRRENMQEVYPEVDQYLEACIKEVTLMRRTPLNGNTNLYNFLNQSRNCRLHIGSSIDVNKFQVYKDVVQETIERATHRSILLKEMKAVCVHTASGQKVIQLDFDSTFEIAVYLDNEDLQSLIRAFN